MKEAIESDYIGPDMRSFKITPSDWFNAAIALPVEHPKATAAVLAATTAALVNTNPVLAMHATQTAEDFTNNKKVTYPIIGGITSVAYKFLDSYFSGERHVHQTPDGFIVHRVGPLLPQIVEDGIEGAAIGYSIADIQDGGTVGEIAKNVGIGLALFIRVSSNRLKFRIPWERLLKRRKKE